MNNPIVEKLKGQIQEYRTAEHFKEVLSCYYSGNLRSAVVIIYATVICDMISHILYKFPTCLKIRGVFQREAILPQHFHNNFNFCES